MAEFASLPLFTDAYLADAGHLSYEEHGMYLLMLIHMWRSPGCRFPDDDEWLARKFKLDANAVRTHMRPLCIEFMYMHEGWITQKRLQKEWEYCQAKREKNKSSAKIRWALKNKGNDGCERISERNATETQSVRYAPTPTLNKKVYSAVAPNDTVSEEKELFEEGKQVVGKNSRRGTRLSEGTQISEDDKRFALRSAFSEAEVATEWANFVDYWISVPGQRGTKLDWSATWRNRVREVAGRRASRRGGINGHVLGTKPARGVILPPDHPDYWRQALR